MAELIPVDPPTYGGGNEFPNGYYTITLKPNSPGTGYTEVAFTPSVAAIIFYSPGETIPSELETGSTVYVESSSSGFSVFSVVQETKTVNKVVYGTETLIDLTNDTVTPDKLADGATAHDKSGNQIVGTMGASIPSLVGDSIDFDFTMYTTVTYDGLAKVTSYTQNGDGLGQPKVSFRLCGLPDQQFGYWFSNDLWDEMQKQLPVGTIVYIKTSPETYSTYKTVVIALVYEPIVGDNIEFDFTMFTSVTYNGLAVVNNYNQAGDGLGSPCVYFKLQPSGSFAYWFSSDIWDEMQERLPVGTVVKINTSPETCSTYKTVIVMPKWEPDTQ